MKLKLKISIADGNNESFMGIGLVWLLGRIKRFRSINLAAKDMKMSYAKAHYILKRLERNLGQKLLIKRKGGYDRGGTELTPFAEGFIQRYDRYQRKVKRFAEKEFPGFFKGLDRFKRP